MSDGGRGSVSGGPEPPVSMIRSRNNRRKVATRRCAVQGATVCVSGGTSTFRRPASSTRRSRRAYPRCRPDPVELKTQGTPPLARCPQQATSVRRRVSGQSAGSGRAHVGHRRRPLSAVGPAWIPWGGTGHALAPQQTSWLLVWSPSPPRHDPTADDIQCTALTSHCQQCKCKCSANLAAGGGLVAQTRRDADAGVPRLPHHIQHPVL